MYASGNHRIMKMRRDEGRLGSPTGSSGESSSGSVYSHVHADGGRPRRSDELRVSDKEYYRSSRMDAYESGTKAYDDPRGHSKHYSLNNGYPDDYYSQEPQPYGRSVHHFNSSLEDWDAECGGVGKSMTSRYSEDEHYASKRIFRRSPSPIQARRPRTSISPTILRHPHPPPLQPHRPRSPSPLQPHRPLSPSPLQPHRPRSPSPLQARRTWSVNSPEFDFPRRSHSPSLAFQIGRARSPSPFQPRRPRSPSPLQPRRPRSPSPLQARRPQRSDSPIPQIRRPRSPSPILQARRPMVCRSPSVGKTPYFDDESGFYNTEKEDWDSGPIVNVNIPRNYVTGYAVVQPPKRKRHNETRPHSVFQARKSTYVTPDTPANDIFNSELENWDDEKPLVHPPASPPEPTKAMPVVKIKQEKVEEEPELKIKIKVEKLDKDELPQPPENEIEPGERSPTPPPPENPELKPDKHVMPMFDFSLPNLSASNSKPEEKRDFTSLSPPPSPKIPRWRRRSGERRRHSPDSYTSHPASNGYGGKKPVEKKKFFKKRLGRFDKGTYGFDVNIDTTEPEVSEPLLPPPPPIPTPYSHIPGTQNQSQHQPAPNIYYNMPPIGIGPLGLLPHQIATLLPHQLAALAQLVPMQPQLDPLRIPVTVPQYSPMIHAAVPGVHQMPIGNIQPVNSVPIRAPTPPPRINGYDAVAPRRVAASAAPNSNGDDENWEVDVTDNRQGSRVSLGLPNLPIHSSAAAVARKNAVVFDYGHGSTSYSR